MQSKARKKFNRSTTSQSHNQSNLSFFLAWNGGARMWVNLQEIVLISYFMNKEPWSMNDTNIRGQRDLPHSKTNTSGVMVVVCLLLSWSGGRWEGTPPPPSHRILF